MTKILSLIILIFTLSGCETVTEPSTSPSCVGKAVSGVEILNINRYVFSILLDSNQFLSA